MHVAVKTTGPLIANKLLPNVGSNVQHGIATAFPPWESEFAKKQLLWSNLVASLLNVAISLNGHCHC